MRSGVRELPQDSHEKTSSRSGVIEFPEMSDAKQRKALESLVWKHAHRDYKATFARHSKSVRALLTVRGLEPISEMTTAELLSRIPSNLRGR